MNHGSHDQGWEAMRIDRAKVMIAVLVAAALLFVYSVYHFDIFRLKNHSLTSSEQPAAQINQASVLIRSIVQRPWMISDQGRLMSESELQITNSGEPFEAWALIRVTGEQPYMQPVGTLSTGRNEVIVNVLELHKDGDKVSFAIYDNAEGKGNPLNELTRPQQKIKRWKIYVAHDMHLDIGYTHTQEQLNESIFPGFLDDAFRLIEQTDSWEERERFRYPIEASYMLYESAWNARNADWLETLKTHLNAGRITYPSSYVNEVYGGLGTEELARIHYYSERFMKDRLGTASNKVLYISDEPSFSWAAVDTLSEAGIRYLMLRQNPDPLTAYPKLFYYEGRTPDNKVLAYNYGHYSTDAFDFRNADNSSAFAKITEQLIQYDSETYPYDAIIADFTTPHDNQGITASVKENIQALNERKDHQGRDYVYPEFINSTVDDFFEYVESNFEDDIPAYRGNMESWWNYGVSSASHETAINKENHDKLPAAEMFATFASVLGAVVNYPYEQLSKAYNHMILFDEHTWGNAAPQPDDQWKWKRNNAITGSRLADQVMEKSLAALSEMIPAEGRTIAVFNPHAWERSDLVTVKQAELPAHFELTDGETGEKVAYQKLEDGTAVFVAENVPGVGYKTFKVTPRADDPEFDSVLTVSGNLMENAFFKITFAETGAIQSIVDKRNGNAEMVDASAPYVMNDFVYFTTQKMSYDVISSHTITQSELSGAAGPVVATMTADGITEGVKAMKRKVILYDALPRIDIINEVVKTEAPSYATQDEEAFFVFPLHVPNFMLRHEMPAGDVRPYVRAHIENPDNEQFYGSSTAYYTVNRWIDASDQSGYGITLSPVSNPIVQYGERRSALGPWDYNTTKPWIYSFIFNNKWHTNFQKTQPGPVTFKYSITSHSGGDWQEGRADRFGMEAANGLKAHVITDAQPGSGLLSAAKGQFIAIDSGNVVLTAAKVAEANGEGIILRFNETLGRNTRVTVDLGMLDPISITETDLVENDRETIPVDNGRVTFQMDGYGWKTLRVMRGNAPDKVTGAEAKIDSIGTQITWNAADKDGIAYYEVFRSTHADFTPGTGNYLASVSVNHAFDPQVTTESKLSYYYKIRAVQAGSKGAASDAAMAIQAAIEDTEAPTAPSGLNALAMSGTRVSLSWEPSADNVSIGGYKLYRNNIEIKDLGAHYNSFLDTETKGGQTYEYVVAAYDVNGNVSALSPVVSVITPEDSPSDGNIAPLAEVSASSEYSSEYGADKAIDGIAGVHGSGEWASAGEQQPWLRLDWSEPKPIDKIFLFDRVNLLDNANEGLLTFSDGSSVEVTGIAADGAVKEITFDVKTVTWVKFESSGGTGSNVGLSEIQVFEQLQKEG